MKIILISGKAQSGKDSVANFIKEHYEQEDKKVLIARFADLLKYIAKTFFNWDGKKDEEGRTLLQWLGTDIIRSKHPDYWVDFLVNFLSMFPYKWDYVLIPDTRFENELKKWDDFDIIKLRVERLNFVSTLTPEQLKHRSEIELDDYNFDYFIRSKSGLNNLKKETHKFISWMEVDSKKCSSIL